MSSYKTYDEYKKAYYPNNTKILENKKHSEEDSLDSDSTSRLSTNERSKLIDFIMRNSK